MTEQEPYDVLIVDDEQIVIDSVKKVLAGDGLAVDEATDAEAALRQIERRKYRMIIVDLMMPKISGTRLLQTVVGGYPDTPIVLTTGFATGENAVQMIKLGAFDFLPKPFTADELSSMVHRALRFRRIQTETDSPASTEPAAVPAPRRGPRGLRHLGSLSWAAIDGEGLATIGLADGFQRAVGRMTGVELPVANQTLQQGGPLARVYGEDSLIHVVLSPLGGQVVELNAGIVANPVAINDDPYGRGWLVRLRPADPESELANLLCVARS